MLFKLSIAHLSLNLYILFFASVEYAFPTYKTFVCNVYLGYDIVHLIS